MYDLHEAAKRGEFHHIIELVSHKIFCSDRQFLLLGNEKSVEELLRNGVKVDAENGNKQTALHKASEKGLNVKEVDSRI